MNIALLTDGIYPFVIGGMQRHSYFLAKYLAKNKIKVRVYHCIKNEENYIETLHQIFSKEELEHLEFITIPFDFSSKFPGYYILESYRYSKRIYKHLIKDIEQFDFIYAKGFTAWYLLSQKKSYFPKIGIKLHGYEMYQHAQNIQEKLKHSLLRIPAQYITQNADIVFSYGGKITEIILHQLKVNKNKIIELPTGIEKSLISEKISEYHHPLNFIFIGRYEKRKGIENLNTALLHLKNQKLSFVFHFIGDIPEQYKLNHSQIIYHGAINNYAHIQNILKNADVLVCPSYSEGMPNVIVEAMANGLTVIATDVGAVNILVNEQTGYLIKNNNVQTLIDILQTVIKEKQEVLQSKKNAALQHIQNFTWEKIIDNLIDKIKTLSPLR